MGQSQTYEEPAVVGTLEDEYVSLSTGELQALAEQRGLPVVGTSPERALLQSLLRCYDIGRRAGGGDCSRSVGSHESDPSGRSSSKQVCSSVLSVLQKIRDAPGHMGCDIGGSLAKMVMAFPEAEEAVVFPEKFGTSGRCHGNLQMKLTMADQSYSLVFLSGATCQLEEAVEHLGDCRRQASEGTAGFGTHMAGQTRPEPASPSAVSEHSDEGRPFTRTFSSWSDEVFTCSNKAHRRMATAGGGACKFASLFRDALRVELEPVREMRALVDGFLLLAPCNSIGTDSTGGSGESPNQDIFTINEDDTTVSKPWPDPLFPLILCASAASTQVHCTGVSILRVDSAQPGDFVRVGGTACGGGTFLGLARLLTSATSFEDALDMASLGDACNADKLVSDIYGDEGLGRKTIAFDCFGAVPPWGYLGISLLPISASWVRAQTSAARRILPGLCCKWSLNNPCFWRLPMPAWLAVSTGSSLLVALLMKKMSSLAGPLQQTFGILEAVPIFYVTLIFWVLWEACRVLCVV
eukprot:symbB.v1.2.014066.t1/scaffold1007.1/size144738/11